MRPLPWIVNVGLPRTGNHSLCRAVEWLGLRPLHVWHEAERQPETLAHFRANDPACRRFLAQYHVLTDTPFYASRETFEKHYPDTRIVCTTRPREEWVRSMLEMRKAGGEFLVALYGLRGVPCRPGDEDLLRRAYDRHHDSVCRDLPVIDLAESDEARWDVLCAALPDPAAARRRAAGLRWPRLRRSEPAGPSRCGSRDPW